MDPTTLLSQLRDVHSPEAIGAWPPAIGWILITLFVSSVLLISIYLAIRWYRANAWRRAALKECAAIHNQYQKTHALQHIIALSSLLKRSCASVCNDASFLAETGDSFKALLLMDKSPLKNMEIDLLCYGHYQSDFVQLDNDAFLRIKKWIRTLNASNLVQATRLETKLDSTLNMPIDKQAGTSLQTSDNKFIEEHTS